jgi:hypothetical protein
MHRTWRLTGLFFTLAVWLAVTLEPILFQRTAFSQVVSPGGTPVPAQGSVPRPPAPIGPPVSVRNVAPGIPQPRASLRSVPSAIPGSAIPGSAIPGGVEIRQSYDGIDFLGSGCSCLPPDPNAAVGNNFVVQTVNLQIRIFDRTSGSLSLDEPLISLFGAAAGSDPYVVYDDIADRWYVVAMDGNLSGLLLAVSVDGNPLHGFLPAYHLTDVGGFPDYPKLGFNQDAIFISFNDYGSGSAAATIVSIDKAMASAGTLVHFVSHPAFQFRSMPAAQMHGDTPGGVQWFVSTGGSDFAGNSLRVTSMTNYLSDSPSFTYTSVPVTPYQNVLLADQPGGSVTTFPNTMITQVHYRNGHLVTAMASGTEPGNVSSYPKGHLYQIDISGETPTLLKQRTIDPGPAVAVQMLSVDEDRLGNLGFTWMESSSSEYLSMWVGTLDTADRFAASVASPGGGFFFFSSRIGDYSTTVLDPSDGRTFWSASEYIGNDGESNVWRTHITSFTLPATQVSVSIRQSINPRGGVIQVTILSTRSFDASAIDPSTVEFGPNGAHQTQKARIADVNGDGLADLALHFRLEQTGIKCGDTSASITGQTFGGQTFKGSDSFRTLGCQ